MRPHFIWFYSNSNKNYNCGFVGTLLSGTKQLPCSLVHGGLCTTARHKRSTHLCVSRSLVPRSCTALGKLTPGISSFCEASAHKTWPKFLSRKITWGEKTMTFASLFLWAGSKPAKIILFCLYESLALCISCLRSYTSLWHVLWNLNNAVITRSVT